MPGSSGISPTKKASSIQETVAKNRAVVSPKLPERRKSVSAAKKEEIKTETIDDDVVVIPQTSSIIGKIIINLIMLVFNVYFCSD